MKEFEVEIKMFFRTKVDAESAEEAEGIALDDFWANGTYYADYSIDSWELGEVENV